MANRAVGYRDYWRRTALPGSAAGLLSIGWPPRSAPGIAFARSRRRIVSMLTWQTSAACRMVRNVSVSTGVLPAEEAFARRHHSSCTGCVMLHTCSRSAVAAWTLCAGSSTRSRLDVRPSAGVPAGRTRVSRGPLAGAGWTGSWINPPILGINPGEKPASHRVARGAGGGLAVRVAPCRRGFSRRLHTLRETLHTSRSRGANES